MSRLVCKIELDGKIIFSKPFNSNESLDAIRGIIKDRVATSFVFLDQDKNFIEKSDEKDFKLEDIINEKILKLKSGGDNPNSFSEANDSNGSNIRNANKNKELNNVKNIEFICDKVENRISEFKNIDLIIVDPPRAGLDHKTKEYLKIKNSQNLP